MFKEAPPVHDRLYLAGNLSGTAKVVSVFRIISLFVGAGPIFHIYHVLCIVTPTRRLITFSYTQVPDVDADASVSDVTVTVPTGEADNLLARVGGVGACCPKLSTPVFSK